MLRMTRVLVVDDDTFICEVVRDVLEDEGYIVQVAANGAAALNCMSEQWPDVVLVDLRMPVMDGWTFLHVCRQDPRASQMCIVLMSAVQDELPELEPGAAHLPKPFDLVNLSCTVERVLAARSHVISEDQAANTGEGLIGTLA